jgi:DNA primase
MPTGVIASPDLLTLAAGLSRSLPLQQAIRLVFFLSGVVYAGLLIANPMANSRQSFPPNMIGPSASFYDPDQHQQQQQQQWDYQDFNFAYSAPGASYDQLVAQYSSYPPPQQQQQQAQQQQQQAQQPLQYPPYPPTQSTSNAGGNPNINHNSKTNITTPPSNAPALPSSGSAPKRKRTAKKVAPAPQSVAAYSDNSDSDDGFGSFSGGGAGISVGMGGLGVRSKGARL